MNLDYDRILNEVKKLNKCCNDYKNKKNYKELSDKEFENNMKNEFSYIETNLNSIFKQCISGHMDIAVLTYMINQAKDIKKNKISNHDASVNVGQKLVDKFVKPK